MKPSFTYYGVIRDDEFLLSTVKAEASDSEDNPEHRIHAQLNSWFNIYPDSKLRVAKLSRRNDNGWVEA